MIPLLSSLLLLLAGPETAPALPVPALDPPCLAQKERVEKLLPSEAQESIRTAMVAFREDYAAAPEPRDPVAIAGKACAAWAPGIPSEPAVYLVLLHAAGYAETDVQSVLGAMHSMTVAKQRLRDFLVGLRAEARARNVTLPEDPAPKGRQDWHGAADFQQAPGLGFEYPVTPEYPPAPPAIRLLTDRQLVERHGSTERQLRKLDDLALDQRDALARIEALQERLRKDLATLVKRIAALPDAVIRAKTGGAPPEGRPVE